MGIMVASGAALFSGIRSSERSGDWLGELAVPDFSWVVNAPSRYSSLLRKIPDIFAWQESSDHFASLQVLARSVALHRFRSCLDHIGRYDADLFKSMRTTFEELPALGKLRFLMAPETFYRISRLRKEPVDSISFLCNALNGEAAFHGLGAMNKGYSTALGDFYCPEPPHGGANEGGAPTEAFRAPLLRDTITIDFDSVNAAAAQEMDVALPEYVQYSAAEKSRVCEKLNATFAQIKNVSEAAADLIKEHIKVIVPFKTATAQHGSTSQPHVPGRVLLRGVDQINLAMIASALVHEAMHQVLYILEWAGTFVVEDPDARAVRVKSLWTGRDLALHSYIHACFIWYGLANFFFLAQSSRDFEISQVKRELARSLSGFRDRNPVDQLAPHAGMLRYDVLKVAGTLWDRLQYILQTVAHD
jgi:hypothetical protein